MTYVENVLLKEKKRLLTLKDHYEELVSVLPKGSIQKRPRGDCVYYYRAYRNGDRVISEYVGNTEEAALDLREQIEKRKHMKRVIAKIQKELKVIDKITEGIK